MEFGYEIYWKNNIYWWSNLKPTPFFGVPTYIQETSQLSLLIYNIQNLLYLS